MNTKMPGGYMCGADCTENAKQLQLIFLFANDFSSIIHMG